MSNKSNFGFKDWLTPSDIAVHEYQHNLNHYYQWLFRLSATLFEWQGLPDTVSERYIEMMLNADGRVLFIKPDGLEPIVVKATETNLNVYGDGRKYQIATPVPISPNQYTDENAVMIYNDDFKLGMLNPLSIYAKRLADNEKIRNVNQSQLLTPTIIPLEERNRLSFQNALKKIADGAITIFTGKNIDFTQVKALDLGAKYYLDKLQEDKQKIWNEALTYIGVENNNNQKRERNITTEIESNNMQTILSAHARLKQRQLACEKINKMFGLSISVDFREKIEYKEQEGLPNADTTKDDHQ